MSADRTASILCPRRLIRLLSLHSEAQQNSTQGQEGHTHQWRSSPRPSPSSSPPLLHAPELSPLPPMSPTPVSSADAHPRSPSCCSSPTPLYTLSWLVGVGSCLLGMDVMPFQLQSPQRTEAGRFMVGLMVRWSSPRRFCASVMLLARSGISSNIKCLCSNFFVSELRSQYARAVSIGSGMLEHQILLFPCFI